MIPIPNALNNAHLVDFFACTMGHSLLKKALKCTRLVCEHEKTLNAFDRDLTDMQKK